MASCRRHFRQRSCEGKHKADWVIVGAGFAGLAAARRLSQLVPQDRIMVVDAQRMGWGAAGRNSGFMIDLPHELGGENYGGSREHDFKQIRMNRAAIEFSGSAAAQFRLQSHLVEQANCMARPHHKGSDPLKIFERASRGPGGVVRSSGCGRFEAHHRHGFLHWRHVHARNRDGQPAGFHQGPRHRAWRNRSKYSKTHLSSNYGRARSTSSQTAEGEIVAPRLFLTVNGHLENFGFFQHRLCICSRSPA